MKKPNTNPIQNRVRPNHYLDPPRHYKQAQTQLSPIHTRSQKLTCLHHDYTCFLLHRTFDFYCLGSIIDIPKITLHLLISTSSFYTNKFPSLFLERKLPSSNPLKDSATSSLSHFTTIADA